MTDISNPKGLTMIPDRLPTLAAGKHDEAAHEVCAMEAAARAARAAYAAAAAADAADERDTTLVNLWSGLIDEYDRLTGRGE